MRSDRAMAVYEVESALRRAQGSADVLRGIPAYYSTWSAFDGIADCLKRALESLRKEAA